jgi:hypothetical protein
MNPPKPSLKYRLLSVLYHLTMYFVWRPYWREDAKYKMTVREHERKISDAAFQALSARERAIYVLENTTK